MHEALELRRQHQVDEQQGDEERVVDLTRRFGEVARDPAERRAEARRQLVIDDGLKLR
jgi:hypothetical protein